MGAGASSPRGAVVDTADGQLALACKRGHQTAALRVLDTRPPRGVLNAVDQSDGGTPLHWACFRSLSEVAMRLTTMPGVDVDAPFHVDGTTPLWQACNRGLDEVAIALLDTERVATSVRDAWDRTTPLWQACSRGLERVALRLLETDDVDINVQATMTGTTPLWQACQQGLAIVAARLLALGARDEAFAVDARSRDNATTPLYWACRTGLRNVATTLLESGAVDVDARRRDGVTPLWWACASGLSAVALHLLRHPGGVDVNCADASGASALRAACESGLRDVALRLIELGCGDDVLGAEDGRARTARCVELLRPSVVAAAAQPPPAPEPHRLTREPVGGDGCARSGDGGGDSGSGSGAAEQAATERCDRVVDTLVAVGASPERLMLAAASLESVALARRCEHHGARGTRAVKGDGRVARAVGMQSGDARAAAYFARLGGFLARYALANAPPVHRSKSCLVLLARDVAGGALGARGDARYGGGEDGDAQGEAVALKLMRTRAECVREIYLPLHFVRILLTI